MKIVIRTLRTDFLLKIRDAGLDDQNQKVIKLAAHGGEPCRDLISTILPLRGAIALNEALY